MRLFTALCFAAAFTTSALADVPVVTAIGGASAFTLEGNVTAFGGTAGSCVGTDTISPCNSCTAALTACNTLRIFDALRLVITATHADAGNLIAVEIENNTTLSPTPHNSTNVSIPWGTICNGPFESNGGCDGTFTGNSEDTIRVCLDKDLDNIFDTGEECADVKIKVVKVPVGTDWDIYGVPTQEGIATFVPYPGDEKVYMEDLETSAVFPTMTYGGIIKAVRVFIGENNMTEATPGSGLESVDLPVIEDGNTLENNIVDALENNKPYWFRIGLVDDGNNVVQFLPGPGTESCDTGLPCSFAATPDQVLGLLTEDVNCFIASAAYGTSLGETLDTFREFRFKRLLPYEWGRRFVKSYYKYGPYAARYIQDKPILRAATRGLLWPAYGFSRLSLNIGLLPATLLSLFALTLTVALPLYGVRRISRRA